MLQKAVSTAPECEVCGATKNWVKPGVRKDGTEYEGFWGCPNWKEHKNTTPAPQTPQKPYYKPAERDIPAVKEKESPRDAILVDLLNEINSKLDIIIKEII